jgi:hypothetical protein
MVLAGCPAHSFANTIREAKAISYKRTVRLGDSETDAHTIVFRAQEDGRHPLSKDGFSTRLTKKKGTPLCVAKIKNEQIAPPGDYFQRMGIGRRV